MSDKMAETLNLFQGKQFCWLQSWCSSIVNSSSNWIPGKYCTSGGRLCQVCACCSNDLECFSTSVHYKSKQLRRYNRMQWRAVLYCLGGSHQSLGSSPKDLSLHHVRFAERGKRWTGLREGCVGQARLSPAAWKALIYSCCYLLVA